MIYSSVNAFALDRVPPKAARVLDIGCGSGVLGAEIKSRYGATVTGITYSNEEAALAASRLDKVVTEDLNQFDVRTLGRFDCIICSHVLEHLNHPDALLKQLHHCLTPGATLIIVLPNILFWKQRLLFLAGNFKYTDEGLMDRTHVRFFDWETAQALLRDAGFTVRESFVDGMVPLKGLRSLFPALCRRLDQWIGKQAPGLFGVQFVFTCAA